MHDAEDLPWVTYSNVGDGWAEANGQEMYDLLCEVHQSLPGSATEDPLACDRLRVALQRVEAFFSDKSYLVT